MEPFRCFQAFVLTMAAAGSVQAAEPADNATPPTTQGKPYRADPTMPAYALPDPLLSIAGEKITTADTWRHGRRDEVLELFRQHVYGRVPSTKYETRYRTIEENRQAIDGTATLKRVAIDIVRQGKSITIELVLFVPNDAPKPAPAFLLICNRPKENIDPTREKKSEFWPAEEVLARGYAVAAFHNADVDPDRHDGFRDGIHGVLDEGQRSGDAWGTIAAWAWGASRVMDYFQTDRDIDTSKIALIGHSRGGKTALWAGAEDERFGVVISNDSGCTGASLSRRKFAGKESVARINKGFPHWFCENYKQYDERENELPVDQHMLVALIAPRAVSVASAAEDLWADPRGEFLSVVHAAPVYRLFGHDGLGTTQMPAIDSPIHGDRAHYHIRSGKHNLNLVDWTHHLDFADQVFGRTKPR
jgi:hypothetical protein